MTPQEFVNKWRNVTLKERAAAQEHFIDLCRLVSHPTPAEDDPTGERFAFEAGADKQQGGKGWADVWKRGFFAWEYKGKHADLKKAYDQLLQYRESLLNPPLLVVSDIDTIIVHTNFTNTVKLIIPITLDALLTPEGMRNLRAIFFEPTHFRAEQTTEQVTRQAAEEFARLAEHLRKQGEPSDKIAHFLIRLLFCLFAEDIELLPKGLFARMIALGRSRPQAFNERLRQLFEAMATGGIFGDHDIRHFNGGLFDNDRVLPLDSTGLEILHRVSTLDWSNIEPSIFGTLFERSLDPSKRSQLGAHYTSKEDILLIVEPVLMAPLRREWTQVQQQATELAQRRDTATTPSTRSRHQNELERLISGFSQRLATIRVLDPACGSGNFLYVALRTLLDLWKEVAVFAGTLGLSFMLPLAGFSPSPEQVYGIEINEYAYELAQATVWIGYIQWLHENGYGVPSEPILKLLDNIKHMDAILAYDGDGKPVEPEWPMADVIIGNPPFLGGKRILSVLGEDYTRNLFKLYLGRVGPKSDVVCYWFSKARELLSRSEHLRVGLLATQNIRSETNHAVLEAILKTGQIFMAWSDREWVLDGADVRVSIVGFDNNKEAEIRLDGNIVAKIHSNLTSAVDVTQAKPLSQNTRICLRTDEKGGDFEIPNSLAQTMLDAPINANGRPNSDVILPWLSGIDIVQRPRNLWIIDFGIDMSIEDASLYEQPFEYVEKHVKLQRASNRIERLRTKWWIHRGPGIAMRSAKRTLDRYIVTLRVAKHPIFTFVPSNFLPDVRLIFFARSDDYFLGVLQSIVHVVWFLENGTRHGVGNDPTYITSVVFQTFPFPWPPGQEPTDDPRVQAIAQAAKELVEKRDSWLNPPGVSEADLKKRTLTNLYNARPTWLDLAHKQLDKTVLEAYGWSDLMTNEGINEEELLARLLALNLERAKNQPVAQSRLIEEDDEDTDEV